MIMNRHVFKNRHPTSACIKSPWRDRTSGEREKERDRQTDRQPPLAQSPVAAASSGASASGFARHYQDAALFSAPEVRSPDARARGLFAAARSLELSSELAAERAADPAWRMAWPVVFLDVLLDVKGAGSSRRRPSTSTAVEVLQKDPTAASR